MTTNKQTAAQRTASTRTARRRGAAGRLVSVLGCAKGGSTTFFEVPLAHVRAAGLRVNEHGVVGAGYPEVAHSVDFTGPTVFPVTCPACGAAKVLDTGAQTAAVRTGRKVNVAFVQCYQREAAYACGGAYTTKPQCQNHTAKWWGHCPAAASRVNDVLARNGVEVVGPTRRWMTVTVTLLANVPGAPFDAKVHRLAAAHAERVITAALNADPALEGGEVDCTATVGAAL